ncbi:hypothetical protein HNP93_000968 [Methanococcus maripaludis]|uniref:Uncharacterized protein n=1 Tax=Methanococcus maripaludis TaxID=39152 RepID=A0A7J9P6B5_METMI|nr:hypothetical protein [Methanococcus maripaludis]MBA2858267.1 hypothetical protein [Methanococcus maripaludis]
MIHYFAVITTREYLEGLGVCGNRELQKVKKRYGEALRVISKQEYERYKKLINRPKSFRKFKVERRDLTKIVRT